MEINKMTEQLLIEWGFDKTSDNYSTRDAHKTYQKYSNTKDKKIFVVVMDNITKRYFKFTTLDEDKTGTEDSEITSLNQLKKEFSLMMDEELRQRRDPYSH